MAAEPQTWLVLLEKEQSWIFLNVAVISDFSVSFTVFSHALISFFTFIRSTSHPGSSFIPITLMQHWWKMYDSLMLGNSVILSCDFLVIVCCIF